MGINKEWHDIRIVHWQASLESKKRYGNEVISAEQAKDLKLKEKKKREYEVIDYKFASKSRILVLYFLLIVFNWV